MRRAWLLAVITFLSAFLMFQIELIVAKKFLPVYGGSYLVWGACMVFFQAALLLGYVAAHYGTRLLGTARYLRWHLVLLILPFLFFPGRALHVEGAHMGIPLSIDVFFRLIMTIGPVFFVLATVSLVTQMWLGNSGLKEGGNPYFLYGISNAGSFLALFSYPFFFERYLTLAQQLTLWRGGYAALFFLTAAAFFIIKTRQDGAAEKTAVQPVSREDALRWFLLGAGGVMVFLGVNNMVTEEIAPIPLLWIIPLGLYLLAYVLNFKRRPWCPKWVDDKPHHILGFGFLFFLLSMQRVLPVSLDLLVMLGTLFALCMYCQRQLYLSRPGQENLTVFYVVMSFGGFVGGMIVTWIVPLVLADLLEFWVGLIVISLAYIWDKPGRPGLKGFFIWLILAFLILLAVWPRVFEPYNFWGLMLLLFTGGMVFRRLSRSRYALSLLLIIALCLWPSLRPFWTNDSPIYQKRNFYGSYLVVDKYDTRRLYHGTTLHGAQFRDPRLRHIPLTYYSRTSPVGRIITAEKFAFRRIGLAGLGVGVLAAYSEPGRIMDFYELDPDIADIARKYFTFLSDAKGEVNLIFGDARLSLEQRRGEPYDLIVVDTFGGDSIPFHLLTVEMIETYRKNLTGEGLLVFHITNRYVYLEPILTRIGRVLGADVFYKKGPKQDNGLTLATRWVTMTWDRRQAGILRSDLGWKTLDEGAYRDLRPWTDDYTYALVAVKFEKLIQSFKGFRPFFW